MNVLVVGGGAREHVICDAVYRSKNCELYSVMSNNNPGISKISKDFILEKETNIDPILEYAIEKNINIVLIGPEAPLEKGLTDLLQKNSIDTCAPTRKAARIETNKEWMRNLLKKYELSGQLKCETFNAVNKAVDYIDELNCEVAIKPIGLTGGKGVRVYGDHFINIDEAKDYIEQIFSNKIGGESKVLIEEKVIGEEFTLQAFSDGKTILPLPAVQDHKRLEPGDKGPNTGGMGSYSSSTGLLPFVSKSDYEESASILQDIVEALAMESCVYIGPIYGQFMLTSNGPKIIEINARFGDPEAMNVLPLLETDYIDICKNMLNQNLNTKKLEMVKKSTVCKYVVPEGYGIKSMMGEKIIVKEDLIDKSNSYLFYASVNNKEGYVTTTSSRSLAVVGVADTINDAETNCEKALENIQGDHIYIRHDIGTNELINKRINHMNQIRGIKI